MVWGIQYYPAAVAAGAGNGVVAGVFIPRDTGLPGVTAAAELGDANKERKVAYALATQIFDTVDPISNKLGLALTKPTPVGAASNRINQTFTLTTQFMANHANNSVGQLPLPAGDTGKITLQQMFSEASIVAAEAAIPEPGILVPNTLITSFGGSVPANTNPADCRSWLDALWSSMVNQLEANTALISQSRGSATGFAPPTNFTGAGAITGLQSADLPFRSFFSVTYTMTLQLLLNQSNQTFDLAG